MPIHRPENPTRHSPGINRGLQLLGRHGNLKGHADMPPSAALAMSQSAYYRSRWLIQDSRTRITSAQELLKQARCSLARQRYRKVVCAWCQQTIRWQRFEQAVRGQVSHSICFDCFTSVFQELQALPVMPPEVSTPPRRCAGVPSSPSSPGVIVSLFPTAR
jgi:hypothetical protein